MELLLERKGFMRSLCMRIGITGAQSVGKTTLLNALRSEKWFKDFIICDEVTRRVKSYGLPINEDGTDNTQHLIMNEHIVNVFMHDNMLTDRTALDGLVYSTYLYKNNKISSNTLKYVKDVFKKVWNSYDYVFYIEPEFEIVDDGVRSIDKQFRDEIAELFEITIDKEKLSIHRVKGSVRDRVNTIIDFLEGR
jgi:nicotinamide riboside kinase